MEYENKWVYKGSVFESEQIENNIGFVYLITNTLTGRMYVGKKGFSSRKQKQVKGKKKRFSVESDWKSYYGSNAELVSDVESLGKDQFHREILYLCTTKGWCSYYEAAEQYKRGVLLSENYYNAWISVKVHKKHLKVI